MKTATFKRIVQSLAALGLVLSGASAFAASTTWGFGNASNCTEVKGTGSVTDTVGTTVYTGTYGNSWTCNTQALNTDPDVTVTAWSTTGSGGAFAKAWLPIWSGGGFGVVNGTTADTGAPNHAIDNNGETDLIFLNFGNYTVDLDIVKLGYTKTDADISIFRYVGVTPTVAGATVGNLKSTDTASGWQLVGNYADVAASTNKAVNTANSTSSWWLISAYNANYGTAISDNGTVNSCTPVGTATTCTQPTSNLQAGNDYFKLLSVAGTATKRTDVPEPTSLALLGLGLIGIVGARRRKQSSM